MHVLQSWVPQVFVDGIIGDVPSRVAFILISLLFDQVLFAGVAVDCRRFLMLSLVC